MMIMISFPIAICPACMTPAIWAPRLVQPRPPSDSGVANHTLK
jgi:hypothetical protein